MGPAGAGGWRVRGLERGPAGKAGRPTGVPVLYLGKFAWAGVVWAVARRPSLVPGSHFVVTICEVWSHASDGLLVIKCGNLLNDVPFNQVRGDSDVPCGNTCLTSSLAAMGLGAQDHHFQGPHRVWSPVLEFKELYHSGSYLFFAGIQVPSAGSMGETGDRSS